MTLGSQSYNLSFYRRLDPGLARARANGVVRHRPTLNE
jgi:hypothetical protein